MYMIAPRIISETNHPIIDSGKPNTDSTLKNVAVITSAEIVKTLLVFIEMTLLIS